MVWETGRILAAPVDIVAPDSARIGGRDLWVMAVLSIGQRRLDRGYRGPRRAGGQG
jgi:hypothetical protein